MAANVYPTTGDVYIPVLSEVSDEDLMDEVRRRELGRETEGRIQHGSGTIVTFSGIRFDLMNPTPDMVHIRDIATGLSKVCRFVGQLPQHYSVAQHSVLVSNLIGELCHERGITDPLTVTHLRLWGLLHDAPEAYMGDCPAPLKECLPRWREIDHKIMADAISPRYGLDVDEPPIVKEADFIIYATERRDVAWNPVLDLTKLPAPIPERIRSLPIPAAEEQFMNLFDTLIYSHIRL